MFEMASTTRARGPLAGGLSPEQPNYDFSNTEPVARITLASPEKILSWSQHHSRSLDRRALEATSAAFGTSSDFGEVKKPETINYRSFKPEKDGLFCERIFGPVKDWECACGKYKRIKYKGIICDRCGVEVTESKVRRVRMGHIKLAAPVSHIWFYKGTSSRISNLLDISVRDLGKVLYFQDYIVVEPGDSPLKEKQILTEEEARKYREVYGEKVKIMIGAEAIRELLRKVDIDELYAELQQEMREATSQQKRQKVIKRLKVVKAFRESVDHGQPNKPEWMILEILPVIPPDLRPLVHLDGGRFATSDLNDLYRRVINRNNRLKRLIELRAPDVILRNEKRMLQEAVDALFDNSRRSRPTKGHNNRPLKSLSDMLKGKQGRFRQNLLGKRVDYSGRSVIVVGPELKFNECGLPKKMALELFDPFIIHELQKRGYCNTIKSAKKMMERGEPVVYDILEDVIDDHPVMLNRAPTLHRLGVQAFFPKLVEGKAIRLHPLACAAFNADFDGDQMAVHVPLSVEARLEAKMLMLAQNNILSPANGKPIATPSQDIVLGCYYLTKMRRGAKGEGMTFASSQEAELAHSLGHVGLHAEVRVRVGERLVKTTPGRVIFANILPPEVDYFDEDLYDFANELMTKKNLAAIVDVVHKASGPQATAKMLDDMKKLGFEYAKMGGVSIAVDHMIIPPNKWEILAESKRDVGKVQVDYERGVITFGERYNRVIDIWTHATDMVAARLMDELKASHEGFNPIYMMAFSGARGNEQQIRQLAGMRGLMQKPTKKITGGIGEIIENPIQSNFREGLTVVEYFISTHGARKGLADTALKTSDAGYLTRRLVDVAQDLIVNEEDCGTVNGIEVTAIKEVTTHGERILQSLSERIDGRTACEPVLHPHTGKVIVDRNELISEALSVEIEDAGVEAVRIRSVLTCETRRGCCELCYGRNLATGHVIERGEAVGVIAAQSIGEPGTQLTLRTFHIGGTASRQLEGWYEAGKSGIVKYKAGLRTVPRDDGTFVVVNRTGRIVVEDDDNNELQVLPSIPYGATVHVADGERAESGSHFVTWQPHVTPIIAEAPGKVKLIDLKPGATLREEVDLATSQRQRIVTEHKEELHPQIQIIGDGGDVVATYALSSGTILSQGLANGSKVAPGDILARIPRAKTRSKDITGGLPRVDELFEARKPKDAAVIADIDGTVNFKGISKGVRKIAIIGDNEEETTYSIPLVRHLTVRDGERVEAGMQLTDGSISPHDILRVKGEKAVQEFLLAEIQEVYRLQGVNINDKHIECIIRQMLKKVIVKEPGDTHFLYDQQVDRAIFHEENQRVIEKGGQPATAEPKLLGLTKASLETESFISAASFQETTRVLTDAAIRGRVDHLRGLKENVIMGLLIPAGTGLASNRAHEVESIHDPAHPGGHPVAAAPVPTADLGPMTPIDDDDLEMN